MSHTSAQLNTIPLHTATASLRNSNIDIDIDIDATEHNDSDPSLDVSLHALCTLNTFLNSERWRTGLAFVALELVTAIYHQEHGINSLDQVGVTTARIPSLLFSFHSRKTSFFVLEKNTKAELVLASVLVDQKIPIAERIGSSRRRRFCQTNHRHAICTKKVPDDSSHDKHFSKARSRTFALLPSTGCLRFSITRGASTLVVQRRGRPSARSVATAED